MNNETTYLEQIMVWEICCTLKSVCEDDQIARQLLGVGYSKSATASDALSDLIGRGWDLELTRDGASFIACPSCAKGE